MNYGFEKIGKVIENSKLAKHLMYQITINWDSIFGTILAKICKPLKVKERTLFIIVKNHSWIQELVFSKSLIINKMHNHSINIKDIKFIVEEKETIKTEKVNKLNYIDKKHLCFIKDVSYPIKDDSIKTSFQNMLKAYIENNNNF